MADDHMLFGHSGGGLFCGHTVAAQPGAFNRYICGSAPLDAGDFEVFRLEERYAQQNKDLSAKVFFGVGEREVLQRPWSLVSSTTRFRRNSQRARLSVFEAVLSLLRRQGTCDRYPRCAFFPGACGRSGKESSASSSGRVHRWITSDAARRLDQSLATASARPVTNNSKLATLTAGATAVEIPEHTQTAKGRRRVGASLRPQCRVFSRRPYWTTCGSPKMKSSVITISCGRSSLAPGATSPAVIRTLATRASLNVMPRNEKPASPGDAGTKLL